jgi:N-acetylmuramoyl-L-alanine amidase
VGRIQGLAGIRQAGLGLVLGLGLGLLLLTAGTALAAGPGSREHLQVRQISLSEAGGATRAEILLNRTPDYRLFTLDGPDRVVLDLTGGSLSPGALPLPAATGAVRQLRVALRSDEGKLRIVFDVDRAVRLRDEIRADGGVPRLVLEMTDPTRRPGAATAAAPTHAPSGTPPTTARAAAVPAALPTTPATASATTPPPAPAPTPPPAPAREIIIAVDAGHGGHDPGAVGPRGVREKDVTLAISRRLVDLINQEPGMRGLLTRKGDEFVILRHRMERARAANADLFLSIHADAVHNRRVRGASVYVLNEKGASDEAARRLAARENAADLIGGVHLGDKDPVLASVLMDLSQNATKSSSIAVGQAVLKELSRTGHVLKPSVQQAPFMVLKSPDVPSLLIETAFISNPDDEQNLRSAAHQEKLAKAILAGVRNYFQSNPPRGTILTASPPGQSAPKVASGDTIHHVVRRGDTLSGVAARYKVSVQGIRAANGLRGDRVRVGQTLRIPVSET